MNEIGTAAMANDPEVTIKDRLRWSLNDLRNSLVGKWQGTCWRLMWLGHKEDNLESHARHELNLAGWFEEEGFYGDMMGHAVMDMIKLFSREGHSGMSAGIAVGLFKVVASFEPLTPLTGADDEWGKLDYGADPHWQNKRCSHVFKDLDGRAYDIQGRIFREPDGCCYTSHDSRVYVTFPYTPAKEYVDVPGEAEPVLAGVVK